MKKETYAKLTKWLHLVSLVIFAVLLIWNFYSPSGIAIVSGDSSEAALADYAATTWIFFTVFLVVFGLNYLLKLFKK